MQQELSDVSAHENGHTNGSAGAPFEESNEIVEKVMQVCGNAKLPLPAAQFESGDGGGQLMLGEGEFAMHLAQLNPVVYV